MVKYALGLLMAAALAAPAVDLPRKSPDLAIQRNDGQPIRLSQYHGKAVVVCFILTSCPHCQKTIGFLTKLQPEYGPRGLQVVASAIADTPEKAKQGVPDFIQKFHPPFPVGFSDGLEALNYMQHPPMLAPHMPLLAFLDRQGTIRAQFEGDDTKFFGDNQEQNLRAQIEALLKPAPPARNASAPKTTPKKTTN